MFHLIICVLIGNSTFSLNAILLVHILKINQFNYFLGSLSQ